MQASVYHLQLNVRDAATSLPFYRALLTYLDYGVTYEAAGRIKAPKLSEAARRLLSSSA